MAMSCMKVYFYHGWTFGLVAHFGYCEECNSKCTDVSGFISLGYIPGGESSELHFTHFILKIPLFTLLLTVCSITGDKQGPYIHLSNSKNKVTFIYHQ